MSIGAVLANARRQAGLSITQVSQRTRIREALIEGIEHDDFSGCGADFYARGHIRAIGRVVGVDPEPLVREYDDATVAVTQEDIPLGRAVTDSRHATAPASVASAQPATALPARPAAGSGPPRASMQPLPDRPRRAPWTVVLVVLLLAAVGVIAYQVTSSHSGSSGGSRPAAAGSPAATHRPAPPTPTPTVPPTTPPASPSPSLNPADVVISLVVAAEPCWAQLTTAAGSTVYQGILNPGATMTWTESQAVTLVLGNPAAVTLTVNGKVDTGLGADPVTLNLAPAS